MVCKKNFGITCNEFYEKIINNNIAVLKKIHSTEKYQNKLITNRCKWNNCSLWKKKSYLIIWCPGLVILKSGNLTDNKMSVIIRKITIIL